MSQQIRLRRAQDKRFQRTNEPEEADVVPLISTMANATVASPNNVSEEERERAAEGEANAQSATEQQQLVMEAKNMCYFCQKCKNHGILVWKKVRKEEESGMANQSPFVCFLASQAPMSLH